MKFERKSISYRLLGASGLICSLFLGTAAAADSPVRFSKILQEEGIYSCLSPKETELFRLINSYRVSMGQPPIENSRSLTKVARIHANDLVHNSPMEARNRQGGDCGLHSWSDQGYWSPVCYTGDRWSAEMMWNKPREITHNTYYRVGYENAYWTSEQEAHPVRVMERWMNSPPHRDLILEAGRWSRSNLRALGVGIHKNVAVMWVGNMLDPLGPLRPCGGGQE